MKGCLSSQTFGKGYQLLSDEGPFKEVMESNWRL